MKRQAIEVLESAMDDDLIIFDPAKTLRRHFRTTYPRKSNRPHVDAMASNLLNRGKQN